MSRQDEIFMGRALALAVNAAFTHPNPRVGAVVVTGGRVVAMARHDGVGTPHAERIALETPPPPGATLYVSLEPCAHEGRTPACAPFVAESGVERVVIAMEDPDERARGRGIEILRSAGLEVDIGVLEERALEINRPYVKHRLTGMPFVSLKLALSLDGRLAAQDGSSRWITGSSSRMRVHRRRAEVDAVMVGAQTVLADDPSLRARDVGATRQPTRVIVDSSGRVPPSAKALGGDGRVIVATTTGAPAEARGGWADAGAEILVISEGEGGVDLRMLLQELGERDLLEIYCEGGAALATSLVAQELVDRLELNYGPLLLGNGGPDIGDLGVKEIALAPRWRLVDSSQSGEDVIVTLERKEQV